MVTLLRLLGGLDSVRKLLTPAQRHLLAQLYIGEPPVQALLGRSVCHTVTSSMERLLIGVRKLVAEASRATSTQAIIEQLLDE